MTSDSFGRIEDRKRLTTATRLCGGGKALNSEVSKDYVPWVTVAVKSSQRGRVSMVTMRDVAERAGVSIATVSFVLNDTKPVTPATRARIEAGDGRARLSGATWWPARWPAGGRGSSRWRTPRWSTASGCRRRSSSPRGRARPARRTTTWCCGRSATTASSSRELLGQGLVDGVVLMEVQLDDPRVAVLRETGTPFALIGRTTELDGLAHVDIDFDATVEDGGRAPVRARPPAAGADLGRSDGPPVPRLRTVGPIRGGVPPGGGGVRTAASSSSLSSDTTRGWSRDGRAIAAGAPGDDRDLGGERVRHAGRVSALQAPAAVTCPASSRCCRC